MSESVSTFGPPRAPDPLKGGLPQAPPLADRWLRPWKLRFRSVVGVWFVFTVATIVGLQLRPIGPPLAILAVGAFFVAQNLYATRKHNRQLGDAVLALTRGNLDEAERSLTDLARRGRGAQLSASAQFNLAVVALARGDVDRALALLQAAFLGAGMRLIQPAVHQTIPFLVALIYATAGDPFAARAWLSHAIKLRTFAHLRFDVVIEAVLLSREHDPVRARDTLEQAWLEVEPAYSMGMTRAVRVVRALLVHEAGEPERAARLAESAKPFVPGEYAWLGARWPEMQSFLAENQLV